MICRRKPKTHKLVAYKLDDWYTKPACICGWIDNWGWETNLYIWGRFLQHITVIGSIEACDISIVTQLIKHYM